MNELRELARTLLTDGEVRVIIGWEDARRGARPMFVTEPDGTDKLIFDARCVHNLVTYLNPRRDHVAELGKIGLVIKGCDAKAVAGLLREAQLTRDDVVLIGVRCGGVLEENELPEASPSHPRTSHRAATAATTASRRSSTTCSASRSRSLRGPP